MRTASTGTRGLILAVGLLAVLAAPLAQRRPATTSTLSTPRGVSAAIASGGASPTFSGTISVASGADIVAAGGVSDFDYSLSSGAFKTPTGTATMGGTANWAANKNITCSAGTTALDLSLGTGVTKTTTGQNTLSGDVSIAAGKDLVWAAGSGDLDASLSTGAMKIGAPTATLAFFGVAAVSRTGAYIQTYATADRTHETPTAATLVDNSGGVAADTVAAITSAANAGSADVAPVANAIATLAREQARLKADHADLAALVNVLIDDLQSYGLCQ